MSLGKIQSYAGPVKSKLQILISNSNSGSRTMTPFIKRNFRSESIIQQGNLTSQRTGLHQKKYSNIEDLCRSFNLLLVNSHNKKVDDAKKQTNFEKKTCKNCEKIRENVKNFIRAKFESIRPTSDKGDDQLSMPIRMHLIDGNPSPTAIFDSPHQSVVSSQCFGCDQIIREAPNRGPPIISPVCKNNNNNNGNMNLAPRGETFKTSPEQVEKFRKSKGRPGVIMNRRERVVTNNEVRESSLHEMKKPHGN